MWPYELSVLDILIFRLRIHLSLQFTCWSWQSPWTTSWRLLWSVTSLNRYLPTCYIILLWSMIIVFNYCFTRLPSLSIYTSKHNNISTGIKITVFLSFYSLVVLFRHFYSLEIIQSKLKFLFVNFVGSCAGKNIDPIILYYFCILITLIWLLPTPFSARPFDFGYLGHDEIILKSKSLLNFKNSLELKMAYIISNYCSKNISNF